MISNSALRVVENNSFASKDFTIQASGKMFHMVISGLYSNKPQSITREIWSNAFDAHAMAGKEDVPFQVTFPTSLNPTFSCRDFGPGIAHENMEGFYTVLGHSTKEGTNKAVGKWGVGRMSPMSYTDTFSVVSRHKGMIAYYTIQLGPDGSPQLHVLAPPMPTTDADGLEVSFPVKRQDIPEFQRAAELVSYGFTLPPTITNSQEKTFAPVKKVFEGEGYYLYEDDRLRGAYAQMGCVLYPIPSQYLNYNRNIVYRFEIGDLEVTASREALSFGPNDPTAANIKAHAAKIETVIFQKMQEELDAQPKMFLAAKLAPKLRRFISGGSAQFNYRGQKLPRYWELAKYTAFDLYCGFKGWGKKTIGWGLEKNLDVMDDYLIFVQDTSDKKSGVRAAARISQAMGNIRHYIWVRADLSNASIKADVDALISELEYPVHYLKDLPDVAVTPRGTRAKVTVSILSDGRLVKHELDAAKMIAGGHYYKMSNNEVPRHIRLSHDFLEIVTGKPLIMVPKTLWSKFDGKAQWSDGELALKAAVVAHADKARATLGNTYNKWSMSDLRVFKDFGGPVGDFAAKTLITKPSAFMGMSPSQWQEILGYYSLAPLDDKGAEAEYHTLLENYPLLRLFQGGNTKLVNEFGMYIHLIDNAKRSN